MPNRTEPSRMGALPVPGSKDSEDVAGLVEKHRNQRGGLIAVLGEVQTRHGYLPESALRVVSERTGRGLEDVYSVATFYRSFSLRPRGQNLVCACLGTACHVRGAPRVVEALERKLGIRTGQTTVDMRFSLETVNCLGACALGPVVVINGRYHSKVKKSAVSGLIDNVAQGSAAEHAGVAHAAFELELDCPHCGRSLRDERVRLDDCPSVRLAAAMGNRRGCVRISSLYGSRLAATELGIPEGSVVEFRCPHCAVRLPSHADCWDCGAPMFSLQVRGGGAFSFCSRRGCDRHMLDVTAAQPPGSLHEAGAGHASYR